MRRVVHVILCAIWPAVAAQRPRIGEDSTFIIAATRGAMKYESQAAAIADGFRPVGVEFPAMGVHWVNLARVMADTVDPARPSVLIYVTVNGEPRLGGVAFTDLLAPGERLRPSPASGFWHEHNGSVTEESLPLHHLMAPRNTHGSDQELRLAILHVWTTMSNPAGAFVTDNWTLPARRLGPSVGQLSSPATRAVSLAQDTTGYYALMLRAALDLSDEEMRIVDAVLADARATAATRLATFRGAIGSGTPDAAGTERALADSWESLWSTLRRRLPRCDEGLRQLRARL